MCIVFEFLYTGSLVIHTYAGMDPRKRDLDLRSLRSPSPMDMPPQKMKQALQPMKAMSAMKIMKAVTKVMRDSKAKKAATMKAMKA